MRVARALVVEWSRLSHERLRSCGSPLRPYSIPMTARNGPALLRTGNTVPPAVAERPEPAGTRDVSPHSQAAPVPRRDLIDVSDLGPIEPHLRGSPNLDIDADLVVRGWPLTVDGLLSNADATRARFSFDGLPLAAISAEVTGPGWPLDEILAGPRLRTGSRYATASVGLLIKGGFGLLPSFAAPHYSVVLDPYTSERALRLLDLLGEVRANPHHVRRRP